MSWYTKVTQDPGKLDDMIDYYNNQLVEARSELSLKGNLEKNTAELPGIVEYRFAQLQEIDAILNFLNIELRKIRRKHFQTYLEHYQRALSSRDVEKYVDGEEEVCDFEMIINDVALVRNKYLGIMKALEQKGYSSGSIQRLKTAGMEDSTI